MNIATVVNADSLLNFATVLNIDGVMNFATVLNIDGVMNIAIIIMNIAFFVDIVDIMILVFWGICVSCSFTCL